MSFFGKSLTVEPFLRGRTPSLISIWELADVQRHDELMDAMARRRDGLAPRRDKMTYRMLNDAFDNVALMDDLTAAMPHCMDRKLA